MKKPISLLNTLPRPKMVECLSNFRSSSSIPLIPNTAEGAFCRAVPTARLQDRKRPLIFQPAFRPGRLTHGESHRPCHAHQASQCASMATGDLQDWTRCTVIIAENDSIRRFGTDRI